jgi:RHS repeat-associated protein
VTRKVTNATASTIEQDIDYKPFGAEAVATSGDNFKFTGYEREDELDYATFRYYKHSLGRFMTPDPVMGNVLNPQTWNRYTYVLNNPTNMTDPTGLDPILTIRITVSANGPGGGVGRFFLLGFSGMGPYSIGKWRGDPWEGLEWPWDEEPWPMESSAPTPDPEPAPQPEPEPEPQPSADNGLPNGDVPVENDIFHNSPKCPNCDQIWRGSNTVTDPRFAAGWYGASAAAGVAMVGSVGSTAGATWTAINTVAGNVLAALEARGIPVFETITNKIISAATQGSAPGWGSVISHGHNRLREVRH